MANRAYLKDLLETNRFYGGNLSVEQCINLYEHDTWLDNGGYGWDTKKEDYLEAWDAFCEGRCVGWQD